MADDSICSVVTIGLLLESFYYERGMVTHLDQDSITHSDAPEFITAPTPKCSSEPEGGDSDPEEGEIVEDSSERESLPRLKKWILYERQLKPSYRVSDHHFAEFQDKYAEWSRKHESIWKHVQQLRESGQDEVASTLITASIAVMDGELRELTKAFGLVDAADMARKIHQKTERSRMSQPRWDDWTRPGIVDLMQKSLPYEAERATVVAALKECRGRVSYALDYLMPGKGIADLWDFEPRYDEDPPTPGHGIGCDPPEDGPLIPGKGMDFDFPDDGSLAPEAGIDFDLPEDEVHTATDVPPNQCLTAHVPGLEVKIAKLETEVLSLKAQLAHKGSNMDLPEEEASTLGNASHIQSREQLLAAVAELRASNGKLEERLRDIRTIAVLAER